MSRAIYLALFLLAAVSAPARAGSDTIFSAADLRAREPALDVALNESGFTGAPDDYELRLVEDENGHASVNVIERSSSLKTFVSPPTRRKNLFIVGIVYSLAYEKGLSLDYQIVNHRRNKISWAFKAEYFNAKEFQTLSLGINKYIGREGLYAGLVASGTEVTVMHIEGTPRAQIGFAGAHVGWQRSWGRAGRLTTRLEIGAEGTIYEFKKLWMPDARIGIGYRIR